MKVATTGELNYARKLLENEEIDLAIKELKKLRDRYPNDTVVLYELGSVLLKQGKESEAFYLLSLARNENNKYAITYDIGAYYLSKGDFERAEENFLVLLKGNDSYKCYGLFGLIKTYIHTEDYETALNCFNRLEKIREYTDFRISHYYNLKFLLLFKNGLLIDETLADNYFRKQLVDYSEEATIEHIKEHLKDLEQLNEEELRDKKFHSVFKKDTDIIALYKYCQELIKDKRPDGYSEVDYYRCKLSNSIGATYSNKETMYVEIVTLPNSKDILSIYPVFIEHVNKNSQQKEKERKQPKKRKYKKNKNWNN